MNKEYWKTNYQCFEEMDAIVNAKEHAKYVHSLFNLMDVSINKIIDLRAGVGELSKEIKIFNPQLLDILEPSRYIHQELYKRGFKNIIENPLEKHIKKIRTYDLAIVNSVFQCAGIFSWPKLNSNLGISVAG